VVAVGGGGALGGGGLGGALGGVGVVGRRLAVLHGVVQPRMVLGTLAGRTLSSACAASLLDDDASPMGRINLPDCLLFPASLLSVQPPGSSSWMPRWQTAHSRWQPCRCVVCFVGLSVYVASTGAWCQATGMPPYGSSGAERRQTCAMHVLAWRPPPAPVPSPAAPALFSPPPVPPCSALWMSGAAGCTRRRSAAMPWNTRWRALARGCRRQVGALKCQLGWRWGGGSWACVQS
jgi:hypothetical protein